MNRKRTEIMRGWLWLLIVATGCTYGDTDRYSARAGKVYIALDWGEVTPSDSTDFYFYKPGEATPIERRGTGRGFEGTLETGTYQVMVVNRGYRNLTVRKDAGYEGGNAYALPAEAVSRGATPFDTRSLLAAPGNLYGTGLPQVVVGGNSENTFTAYPKALTYPLRLDILVVGGAAVKQMDGHISGVSPSVHIPSGKASFEETGILTVPMDQKDNGHFGSSVTTFGLAPKEGGQVPGGSNRLILDIELVDGTRFTDEMDISEAINEAVDGEESGETFVASIELTLEIDLTHPGGFRLQLVDWKTGSGSATEQANETKKR